MGENIDEHYIGSMIEDADDNCDGCLNYEEFEKIMLKVLTTA